MISSRTGVTVQLAFLLAFIALATLNVDVMSKVVNAALAQGQRWAEQERDSRWRAESAKTIL